MLSQLHAAFCLVMSKWIAPVPGWWEVLSNHLQECGQAQTAVTVMKSGQKNAHNQICARVCCPMGKTTRTTLGPAECSGVLPPQLIYIRNVAAFGSFTACVSRFPFPGQKCARRVFGSVLLGWAWRAATWYSHTDRPRLKPIGINHPLDLSLSNLDKMMAESCSKGGT